MSMGVDACVSGKVGVRVRVGVRVHVYVIED